MVTSRSAIAAVVFAGCLQASAWAGTIRGQLDLIPLGQALGRSAVDLHSELFILPAAPTSEATGTTSSSSATSSSSTISVSAPHPHPDSSPMIAPVPEPSGVALAISGLGALAFIAGRRRLRLA